MLSSLACALRLAVSRPSFILLLASGTRCQTVENHLRAPFVFGVTLVFDVVPITLLQMQKHIADSYAEYMAGKHYVYGVAANLDLSSTGNGLDADGTKLYCTTMAKNVADRAMQVSSDKYELHVPRTLEIECNEPPLPFVARGHQSLSAWCDA